MLAAPAAESVPISASVILPVFPAASAVPITKAPSAPLVPVPIAPVTLTAPSVLAIVKARACDACELIVELKLAPPPPVVKVRSPP